MNQHVRTPTIQATAATGLQAFAEFHGANYSAALKMARLTREQFSSSEDYIPLSRFCDLLRILSVETRDVHFALHFGERMEIGTSGMLGYILANARDVGQFLDSVEKFGRLHVPGGRVHLERGREQTRLVYTYDSGVIEIAEYVDLISAFFVSRLRSLLGPTWVPTHVELEHSGFGNVDEYHRVIGPNILFNANANIITVPTDVLDVPCRGADPNLFKLLSGMMEKVLSEQKNDSTVTIVSRTIAEMLAAGQPTMEQVADKIGLSSRTLQRRLSETDSTFSGLLENVRGELACRKLRSTSLPVSQIANMLGYTELGPFTRAFRRWYKMSPSDYRKRARLNT